MTLIEVMVAVGIGALLVGTLMATYVFFARSFLALSNYTILDRNSRNALDTITKDIRMASGIVSYANNTLILTNVNGGVFSYRSNNHALIRTWTDGRTSVLLTNLDYWNVGIYQKYPGSQFTFVPATVNVPVTGKLIDMSWKCSRQIMQQKVNTESVQTTKIVIRN